MSDDFDPFTDGGDAPAASDSAADSAPVADLGDEVTGADLLEDDDSAPPAASPEPEPVAPVAHASAADADAGGEPEPDAMIEWQEKHNRYLDEKSQKESDAMAEAREKAGQEWDALFQERQAMIDENKKRNRDEEDSFVKERDNALTQGDTWERVAFFCDFQLKGEGRDTNKMRELLIQLKNAA